MKRWLLILCLLMGFQYETGYWSGPFIELCSVEKIFKTSAGEFTALKNINLSFMQGEFTSIMGKSGSGKSTLINMITGIDHPSSGQVQVGGMEVHRMNEGQLAVWRGRALGIVFQFFQLLPTLSVLENTMLPMDFCNIYAPAERESRAMELLKMMGMEDLADKLPAALSGGQQQIAAIARALANDPPVIVADEPTGNLDSRTAELVLEIFDDLAKRGKTILIVTHDPDLARRSTRRVLISDGELINEFIAEALPILGHPHLLRISHQANPHIFQTGSTIARQGALDEGLYIVTEGKVDVLRQGKKNAVEKVDQIQPGGYFSEIEMIETQYCNLTYQASSEGAVSVLCLGLEELHGLIKEAPEVGEALHRVAADRSLQYCPQAGRKFWRRK